VVDRVGGYFGRVSRRLAPLGDERGFTLIELLATTVVLTAISLPIGAVMMTSSTVARASRERTGADQLAQAQIETIRTLAYTQVGIVGGNPPGVLPHTKSASLPSGEQVTITNQAWWINDPVPTAYVTNADYKKVTVTITRNSDGAQLSQKTTYVSAISSPPMSGTTWVQIKRQVVDAVTMKPLVGASVGLTGGPSGAVRNDITDGSGTVLFPALDSTTASPPPAYVLATTFSGDSVFPDDLPPGAAESVGAAPGVNSVGTIRMYVPVSLTVNVVGPTGAPYAGGATVSVDSSRCGVAAVSIPAGQTSTTITSCQYASGKTVPLVPNVLGQTPSFDQYRVTGWTTGSLWSAATSVTVPASYPTVLTQAATVQLSASTYTSKTVQVSVTRGGKADTNARVELSGGPLSVALYATTDSTGTAAFTVPVTSTASTYSINSNDMGVASGSATVSVSSTSKSPIAVAVTLA
jgi:prepilin-type N-terminal cleavage/methylation domain-containing protein